jgi:hypothetical protein
MIINSVELVGKSLISKSIQEVFEGMFKRFLRSAVVLSLVLTLVIGTLMASGIVSAQTSPLSNGWFTSVTFQNVTTENNDANVTIEAYGSTGAAVTPDSPVVIAPGGNSVFLPGITDRDGFVNMTLPEGFQGGLVATSVEPIVAISQVGNNQVGENGVVGGAAIGQYRGTGLTDTSIFYPAVKNGLGNKVTVFSIQAAGGDVEYSATITANDGTTHTKTGSIEQNRTNLLLPETFTPAMAGDNCGDDINVSPCLGSLTVEVTGGSGSLVGAVIETRSDTALQNVGQAATMFTPQEGANTLFCPVVKYESGANQNTSGVVVQNLGNDEATVDLSTILNGGGTGSSSLTIPPGASRTFFGPNIGFDSGSFGAATVNVTSGTGPIVASINESNVTVASLDNQKQVTYTCFNANQASNTVAFPLVKERFGAPEAATSVNLQNISSDNSASVTVSYVCDTGSADISVDIDPNAGETIFLSSGSPVNGSSAPANGNCAVTATAPAGSQIIGLSQDTSDLAFVGGANSILDLRNYEGFNQ